jgi:peptidoglycan biosynthesis protein MviN/MurJ (putative lipid II flippase)
VFYLALQGYLSYVFTPLYGIAGLSWANVVGQWAQFVLLLVFVWRHERFDLLELANQIWRVTLAASLAGLATYALSYLSWTASWWSALAHTTLGVAVFALVYTLASYALGIAEIKQLLHRFRS